MKRVDRQHVVNLVDAKTVATDGSYTSSRDVTGGVRPPWTPQVDPRLDALAAGYSLVLSASTQNSPTILEAHQ